MAQDLNKKVLNVANKISSNMGTTALKYREKTDCDKSFAVTVLGVNQKFTGNVSNEDKTGLINKYSIPATVEAGEPNYYTVKIYGAYYVAKQNGDFKLYDKVMAYLPNGDWSNLYLDYRNTSNVRVPARFYSETEPTEGMQENDYWYEIDDGGNLIAVYQYLVNDETGEPEWTRLFDISSGPNIPDQYGNLIGGTDNTVSTSLGCKNNTIVGDRITVSGSSVSGNFIAGEDNTVSFTNHSVIVGHRNGSRSVYDGIICGSQNDATNTDGTITAGKQNSNHAHYCLLVGKMGETSGNNRLAVGNGSALVGYVNSFYVNQDGNAYATQYNTSGADYGEYFEWKDENPNSEDRRGLLVSLSGDKIYPANSIFVCGVISTRPSVCANAYDDYWHGKYKTDIFGSRVLNENGEWQLSDNYDPTQKYIPRSQRKEWSVVGLVGRLIVCDNGECTTDQYIMAENGIAIPGTVSLHIPNIKMLRRIDDNHIEVLVK